MVYVGSKRKLKKHIVPILQKCIDDSGFTTYVEPFVGGATSLTLSNVKIALDMI